MEWIILKAHKSLEMHLINVLAWRFDFLEDIPE